MRVLQGYEEVVKALSPAVGDLVIGQDQDVLGVLFEGNSQRAAARVFGIGRTTVDKMCAYSAPPGYQRTKPPAKPALVLVMQVRVIKPNPFTPAKLTQL